MTCINKSILGWDIGGAHLKAVFINQQGIVENIYLKACPLWKGLEYLAQGVSEILRSFSSLPDYHAITMTGELVDLFDSREDGVVKIIRAMQSYLPQQEIFIYAGLQGFIKINKVMTKDYMAIASANWLASASLTANHIESGLFIDIGSTTTDILLCHKKEVKTQAFSDYHRLQSQELVYTGIVRTPVMAVSQSAFFQGQSVGLMAEYFATMADVYRLTKQLNEEHDKAETADGAEKTKLASARRLSRMIGYDFLNTDLELWQQFAQQLKNQQKQQIKLACEKQLSRLLVNDKTCLVGAGIGHFLVAEIAFELGLKYQNFSQFFQNNQQDLSLEIGDCAPAAAVAFLFLNSIV